MTKLEKIQQKVTMHHTLKHYFSSFSDEFKRIDYSKKLEFFKEVVQKGFSTYDLSESFRKERSDRYSHDDMQQELVRYIGYLVYGNILKLEVKHYYKNLSDKDVAKDLDAFLLSEDCYKDFKKMFKAKFDVDL